MARTCSFLFLEHFPQVAQRLPPRPLQVSAQMTPISVVFATLFKMLTPTLDLQGGPSTESHTGTHLRVVGTALTPRVRRKPCSSLQQMPTIQIPTTAPAAGPALPGGGHEDPSRALHISRQHRTSTFTPHNLGKHLHFQTRLPAQRGYMA